MMEGGGLILRQQPAHRRSSIRYLRPRYGATDDDDAMTTHGGMR
jgi:hypothetical protein